MADNGVTLPEVDRVAASRAAVAARRARAAVKKDISARLRSGVAVLDVAEATPDSVEGRLRVTEFLTSVPALGATKTQRIMSDLAISSSKRLGGLGCRQRAELRSLLVEREKINRIRSDGAHLVVLAGPTAVGKGTVANYIREHFPDVLLSVSATTRPPRPGEQEGVSYYFVDDDAFDRMIDGGELLEWATVHNMYRYGTPRAPIEAALAVQKRVLLEIDIQGARAVRRTMPDAKLIFLQPPSWDELVSRLVGRGTETPAEQRRRLETATVELEAAHEFDETVINADVAQAAHEVVDLMSICTATPHR